MSDPRAELLRALKGTNAVIPDFGKLMKHYPSKIHPEVDALERDVHKALELIFPDAKDEKRLLKMKSANHALLGASWWPYASFDALCIVTHVGVWLFCWDDEFDSHEFSTMIRDEDAAKRFRQETISYIEASLSQNGECDLSDISTNPLITSFERIAQAVLRVYTPFQIDRLLQEFRYYIDMTDEEQTLKMANRLPTEGDYIHRRLGTSAVGPSLATHEYALGIELPHEVVQCDAMQAVWYETNFIISITNDIFSLKKEVEQCEVDSIVPILFCKRGSLQEAVDEATEMVRTSIERLDAAEQTLLELYSSSPDLAENIRLFVQSCRYGCTGNLGWSLRTRRYGLMVDPQTVDVHISL
ncbi:terpenoid synthase [Xylariaceae sp. FL1272]|nr:terpenoid synthase [Xylariaceae sp. FL1272]